MKMSENGLRLLREWEGCRLEAYQDSGGLWTIGVGHLLTRDELTSGKIHLPPEIIRWADGLTQEQADRLLEQDIRAYEIEVGYVAAAVSLEQHRWDALISFCFNVGCVAFRASTLRKRILYRELDDVPTQLRRWNKVAGKVITGIVNRREKEIALWEGRL